MLAATKSGITYASDAYRSSEDDSSSSVHSGGSVSQVKRFMNCDAHFDTAFDDDLVDKLEESIAVYKGSFSPAGNRPSHRRKRQLHTREEQAPQRPSRPLAPQSRNSQPPRPQSAPKRLKSGGVPRCEYLYEQAGHSRRRREEQQHRHQEEASKRQLDACTFKPALSTHSRLVMEDHHYRAPAERFDAEAQRHARLLMEQRKVLEAKQLEECTFNPTIEPTSVAMAQRSRSSDPRTADFAQRLYAEGRERELRQRVRDNYFRIEQQERKVGAGRKLTTAAATAAADRLVGWQERREAVVEALRREIEGDTIGSQRHVDIDALIERLYSAPRNYDSGVVQENGAQPAISNVSQLLAESARAARFGAMFLRFDTSRAGSITAESIRNHVKALDRSYRGILSALTHFDDKFTLKQDDFVNALVSFERRYGPQQWGRQGNPEPGTIEGSSTATTVHRPIVSSRSKELAAAMRRTMPVHEDLYRRGVAKAQAARHHQMRTHSSSPASVVNEECTFRPKLSRRSIELSTKNLLRLNTERVSTSCGDSQTVVSDEKDELLKRIEKHLSTATVNHSGNVSGDGADLNHCAEQEIGRRKMDVLEVINGVLDRDVRGHLSLGTAGEAVKAYAASNVSSQLFGRSELRK